MSKYGVIAGPYFPTFGLNAERYATLSEKCPNTELFLVQIRNYFWSVFSHIRTECGHFSLSVTYWQVLLLTSGVTNNMGVGTKEGDRVAVFQM